MSVGGALADLQRVFLRASPLDAFAHLAKADDGCRAEFEKALKRASEDEAASVRARVGGLQKD